MPNRLSAVDARWQSWRPGAVSTAMAGLAFFVSAGLQIVGVPGTSSFGTRTRFDMDVYRLGGQIWHQGFSLYAEGSMPFTSDGIWLPFTYPPFAALLFTPLGAVSLAVTSIGISVVTAVALVYVTAVFLRVLRIGNSANRNVLALWLSVATIWFNPTWMTLGFGQINLVLMAMIVVDVFVLRDLRSRNDDGPATFRENPLRGILTGVASAIKLTPLVFLGVFAAAGRLRAVVTGVVAFAAAAVVAWAWMPDDSRTYWTHTVFHTARIGEPAGPINQNLNAAWLRILGEDSSAAPIMWALSCLAVTALAGHALWKTLPRQAFAPGATTLQQATNSVLATCVIAIWGLLVSPTTWAHHWGWFVPAILACLAIAARTDSAGGSRAYLAVGLVGVPIFAIGPFQLLPDDVTTWNVLDHVIGNAYVLWALAFLIVLCVKPFRCAEPAGSGLSTPADATTQES
ncbi:MAG: glycosyltransferase 87 family protein [Gordonia sp. (in: high G+C Gram-positive bacteria)]